MISDAEKLHARVGELLENGRPREAKQAAQILLEKYPKFAPGYAAAGLIASRANRKWEAVKLARRAHDLSPEDDGISAFFAKCLSSAHLVEEALEQAELTENMHSKDSSVFDLLGTVYSQCGEQLRALAKFEDAVKLNPKKPTHWFNLAAAQRFLGMLEDSESSFDKVIRLQPNQYEAYLLRSSLRTQTEQNNHIGELEKLNELGEGEWRGKAQIRYALGKEYEDLGQWEDSFHAYESGATKVRDHIKYDVGADIRSMSYLNESAEDSSRSRTNSPPDAPCPIFIIGLPRTGTTLVESILGAHSQVSAGGELDSFPLAVAAAISKELGPRIRDQFEMIESSKGLNMQALGENYVDDVTTRLASPPYFTDKFPQNFLYLGLIKRALPNCKVVHVTRNPMDTCFAIYKTMFNTAYPYSYNLDELAQYYIAYRNLMQRWNEQYPVDILNFSYEGLVSNQIEATKRLLAYCELEWEESCVTYHQTLTSTMTASAAQVRQPMYTSSIDKWKNYSEFLKPLASRFDESGLEFDSSTSDAGDR